MKEQNSRLLSTTEKPLKWWRYWAARKGLASEYESNCKGSGFLERGGDVCEGQGVKTYGMVGLGNLHLI